MKTTTQLLVRQLEPQVKMRLQRRARKHGRSMEEEAREILRHALREDESSSAGLGTEISVLFRGVGLLEEIPEMRGARVRAPEFEA